MNETNLIKLQKSYPSWSEIDNCSCGLLAVRSKWFGTPEGTLLVIFPNT